MRLIAPLIIALFGAGIGILVNKAFTRSWLAYPAAAVIGAISSFFGLIVRDALDATIFSNDQLLDSLLAALLMSLIVSLIAHILTSFVIPPPGDDNEHGND